MSMTKAFVSVFTKEVVATPKAISELNDISKDEYTIGDGLNVSGYVETDEAILLIVISSKKAIQPPSVYTELFTNCKLVKNEYIAGKNAVYFLVYKSKDKYVVFARDEKTKQYTIKPAYRLAQFASIFSNAETVNSSSNIRKDVADAIQNAWSGLGIGSDRRMQFIVFVWVMLTHDDIPFAKMANGQMCSLREYFERVEAASDSWETDMTGKTYNRMIKQTKDISGKDLIKAFDNVVTYKMKKHCSAHDTKAIDSVIENQTRKFKAVVEALNTEKANQNALIVAYHLWQFIYKQYGNDIDMCKIIFDLEQKWNNRTIGATVSAKGQIYTHAMMKELIIKLFSKNITNKSTCYDPTCGTGGFTEMFYKYASKKGYKDVIAYGNEIDEDCSNMAWVAGFCSDIDVRIFNEDCFDPKIKHDYMSTQSIDFLLMNPPYGMNKGKLNRLPEKLDWSEDPDLRKPENIKLTEWTFCRYNLESFVKPGGWFAFVIPVSCVSENKQNYTDKYRLIDNAEIWFVIRIREDIFTPQAGKACCLVIGRWLPGMRTIKEKNHWRTKCVDFSQDSGEIKRKKGEVEYDKETLERLQNERIFDNKILKGICKAAGGRDKRLKSILNDSDVCSSEWYEERKLRAEDNWLYTRREQTDISQLKGKFQDFIEDRRHECMSTINHQMDLNKLAKPENKKCEWRDVKILDMFTSLGRGKMSTSQAKPDGVYPLISASTVNNGIAGYVDTYAFGDENSLLLTLANNGPAGQTFVQSGRFDCSSDVTVLEVRKEYKHLNEDDLIKIAFLMTQTLTKIYNWSNKLNTSRLQKETVKLPFNVDTNTVDMNITTLFDFEGIETCRDVPVSELFEFVGRGKYNKVNMFPMGEYPLVTCCGHNNGILVYVDTYDYDGTYLSVATNGDATAGMVFIQRGKFTASSNVLILKLKQEYEYLEECLSSLAFAMTNEFRHKYNYSHVLTQERLQKEIIPQIPFIPNPKDNSKMIIDVSGLRYIYIYNVIGDNSHSKRYPINIFSHSGHLIDTPSTAMMKEVKISELFENIEGISDIDRNTLNKGPYPLISSGGNNNAIIDYVDKYNYEGTYISYNRSGTVGTCFVQTGKFMVLNHSSGLLKLKNEYKYLENYLGLFAYLMTETFTKIYSYSTLLNKERLMKETILLPVIVRGIDGKPWKMLANGLTTLEEITNNGKNKDYTYEINENLLTNFVYTMMM